MARFFKEQDIDEFRDCFYLKAGASGQITEVKELGTIMRSLGMSPVEAELNCYLKEKGGKLSFADFLDVMHTHSKRERIPNEILEAFQAWDSRKTGQISTRDLKHILCQWGEKLQPKVVDDLLRETNAAFKHSVNYNDLMEVISAPVPDY